MTKRVVIMAGPMAPLVGGMASVISSLYHSSLARDFDLWLFQTGKTTPEGRRLWRGVWSRLVLLWQWWRLLGAAHRPVAHIHTCSGLTFFLDGALLLMARARRASTMLHIHGGRFDAFLDGLPSMQAALVRLLARRAGVVVVLSASWEARLRARIPGAHWAVVENGVTVYEGAPRPLRHNPTQFLFLGGLSRAKGIDVLLRATAQSTGDWLLTLAGPEAEAGFVDWMHGEIARLKLESRVRWLGEVRGQAKDDAIRAAHAFVLPSLAEGMPLAMLECMGLGLPVVASRVGAIPEVVVDGREGLLVPAGDSSALSAALDRLGGDADLLHCMGSAAWQRCSQNFSVEATVAKLSALYRL